MLFHYILRHRDGTYSAERPRGFSPSLSCARTYPDRRVNPAIHSFSTYFSLSINSSKVSSWYIINNATFGLTEINIDHSLYLPIAVSFPDKQDPPKVAHIAREDRILPLKWLCQNDKCHDDV